MKYSPTISFSDSAPKLISLTQAQKAEIRRAGLDPEVVMIALQARDFGDWKRRMKAAGKIK